MKGLAFKKPADRYFTFEGLKLHYAEWGDRAQDTLILVHGNRGKVVEISGSGHHVPHEKPEELAEVVRPFLFE